MRKGTETDLVRACLALLRIRGWFAFRNNNAGVRRTDRAGRAFWTFAGVRGASDIFALRGGKFLAIETKMPGRGPTPDQKLFAAAVRDAGGLAALVHSVKELEAFLDEAGV